MFFVLVSILLCVGIILWESKRSKAKAPALPPALFGELPLIGHAHTMLMNMSETKFWQYAQTVIEYATQQGGVIYSRTGPQIHYIITDPDDALTVVNTCLEKHPLYSFAEHWLGQGLLTASRDTWQRHRKLLNPAFSLPMIRGFLDTFNSQSKQLKHNLEQHVGQEAFDPASYIHEYALTVTCLTAFGDKNIKDEQFYSKYMSAVTEEMKLIMKRVSKVWLRSNTLNMLIGDGKRERELINILHGLSNEVIKSKRDAYANGNDMNISHVPFIDKIIALTEFTDKEIREELDTTILGGYETSATFLKSALVLIGSYPEVQERMYNEIIEVIGEERDVEKEDLQKFVYTDAVIKECFRYFPTIPIVARYIDKEVKLKNYTLRADTSCILVLHGLHRSAAWGADVNEFKPERWLDPASAANNTKLFAPFSLGKRSCIGKTYALTSAKVVLTHIVRAFKITADHTKMKFNVEITLKPVAGNKIKLQRRL